MRDRRRIEVGATGVLDRDVQAELDRDVAQLRGARDAADARRSSASRRRATRSPTARTSAASESIDSSSTSGTGRSARAPRGIPRRSHTAARARSRCPPRRAGAGAPARKVAAAMADLPRRNRTSEVSVMATVTSPRRASLRDAVVTLWQQCSSSQRYSFISSLTWIPRASGPWTASCHVRTGSPSCSMLSCSTAREWLRVGPALLTLDVIAAAFADGRLSYSKARALTCAWRRKRRKWSCASWRNGCRRLDCGGKSARGWSAARLPRKPKRAMTTRGG